MFAVVALNMIVFKSADLFLIYIFLVSFPFGWIGNVGCHPKMYFFISYNM
jgi:hypothetical protein